MMHEDSVPEFLPPSFINTDGKNHRHNDICTLLELKNLPKYNGKNQDLDIFRFKLQPYLAETCLQNVHKQNVTTPENTFYSNNLYKLLSLCLSGDAITPFIHNNEYTGKGIKMYHALVDLKYPTTESTAIDVKMMMAAMQINQGETFEGFATHLRSMYHRVTNAREAQDEVFLVRCILQGLDDNFNFTKSANNHGTVQWEEFPLNACIAKANAI